VSNRLPLSEWAERGTEIQRRHAANVARLKAAAPPAAPAPPAYPPLRTQLRNLARSAGRFLRSGLRLVRWREYRRRRAVCRACPSGLHDASADRCRACGCLAAVKPWLGSESCPRGHW